jgi:hypothetical protein
MHNKRASLFAHISIKNFLIFPKLAHFMLINKVRMIEHLKKSAE